MEARLQVFINVEQYIFFILNYRFTNKDNSKCSCYDVRERIIFLKLHTINTVM